MGENPELIAMAEQISERYARMLHVNDPRTISDFKAVALAAIIETQERDAALVERRPGPNWPHAAQAQLDRQDIAAAIRSGQHYGKDHPHA